MKKCIIVVFGCGLLALICYMNNRSDKLEPDITEKSGIKTAPPPADALPSSSSSAPQSRSRPSASGAEVVLMPRKVSGDPDEITSAPRPEYVWYTQPTSRGTIKNSKGKIIFQATDELPFVSMRSRANVSQIVIVSANRNAFVIDPETKQRVALPKQPPEKGAKGFESWEWIDNNTLLAEYNILAKRPDGEVVSCCQGHGIAETQLYSYNLKSNALVKVALPKHLEGVVFSIGRIADDGSFEVIIPTNHLIDEKRVGWFILDASK